jgi:UDP-glucose 4-epimerase
LLLVTGGLGFIGAHTTRELVALGEECLVVQRHVDQVPEFLAPEAGAALRFEALDVGDLEALRALGRRERISAIVHLAAPAIGANTALESWRAALNGLANVLSVAREWDVRRIVAASTMGVYAGVADGRFTEDRPLPLTGPHAIPAFKRCAEIACDLVANETGLEIASARIGAIWGPLGHPRSPFFALPELIHAAVRAKPPDPQRPIYAKDGIDSLFVRDCARAVALIATAERLSHRVYNVGSGRAVTNAEVASAILRVIPEAAIELSPGPAPDGRSPVASMTIERLERDTGYRPSFTLEEGIRDYVDWLRAGNPR